MFKSAILHRVIFLNNAKVVKKYEFTKFLGMFFQNIK